MTILRQCIVLCAGAALAAAALGQEQPKEKPGQADEKSAAAESRDGQSAGSSAEVGKPPPDFALEGADGKKYKLADFKDKVLVIEWTSKDCGATNRTVAQIADLAAEYQKKGVAWVAIDSSHYRQREDNVTWIKDKKLPYTILEDFDGQVGRKYGVKNTSHYFVVHKGKIVYSGAPFAKDGARKHLAEALDAVLAGKEVPLANTRPFG